MTRQQRLFGRNVRAWFIIDHAALYRLVESAGIMTGQMAHLAEVASKPNITIQVLPLIVHSAMPSGFLLTDDAIYAETMLNGYVYVEAEKLSVVDTMFDTLRTECYRASESLAIIRKAERQWSGERAPTAGPTGGTASK